MLTLALDVDGVLLDPERNGEGHWTNELEARFGIKRAQLRNAFFEQSWDAIITGRRPLEDGLGEALQQLGARVDVETVLSCWFDTDYVPVDESFRLARCAADAGCRIVLATNQEHRRASYLHRRIGAALPLDGFLYSAELGVQKHDVQFFEMASERLGITAAERASVIFVDDVMANVETARSFGWRAVHASPGTAWHSEVAERLGLSSG